MTENLSGSASEPAAIFNGYVAAHVAFALHELGVWNRLATGPSSAADLASDRGIDTTRLSALLQSAVLLGYVNLRDGVASLTPAGRELADNIGFFRWAVGGYGHLLRSLAALTAGRAQWGIDVQRDEACIAVGAAEVGRAHMSAVEADVVAGLDYDSVADLGCGDGSRLIRLCQAERPIRGLGIDISKSACALARGRVAEVGLADQVDISCQNIFHAGSKAVFPDIDLVLSFLMLHDLFSAVSNGTEVIEILRSTFPNARYFLLADTAAQPWHLHSGALPIFSLQFELVHTFMGTTIYQKETYERAFVDGGLRILRREPLGVPSTWLYLLSTQ
ncbi:MAG TPA: class I SAM-dependent methyltransferase [Streptosporangiaceae bacterium]|nr:class I SAM-dependent methyltransferase [Streptosporangiaceae bacterium]